MTADVDYSQPLATLLKVATSAAHERAEHSKGAEWLTRGELDKEEYVRFLMMLYHVYDALETGLEKHSSHSVLAPTYNPTLLARAPSIASDIAYLLDVPESSWQSHPVHTSLQNSPPAAYTAYVSRIRHLADSAPDPSPLLAHAYVRYLGDLSGGQTIRRSIAKAYCDDEEGLGTQFYVFGKLGGGGQAGAGDMRRIKDWFRAGMNEGGGDDVVRKQAIAEEAVSAFELNTGLFTLLRAPSSGKAPSTSSELTKAKVPLGDPSISLPPSPPSEPSNGSLPSESKYSPLQLAPEQTRVNAEKTFSAGSVVALILAVGLAHFMLVTGGFTGPKGFEKLEAFWKWMGERVEGFFA